MRTSAWTVSQRLNLNYFSTTPVPSISFRMPSTPGTENISFLPLGQKTSALSIAVLAPNPKCRRGSDLLKLVAIQIAEKLRPLRVGNTPFLLVDGGINVPVGYKNVQQAIIVEIQKPRRPGQEGKRRSSQSRAVSHVRKISVAIVA